MECRENYYTATFENECFLIRLALCYAIMVLHDVVTYTYLFLCSSSLQDDNSSFFANKIKFNSLNALIPEVIFQFQFSYLMMVFLLSEECLLKLVVEVSRNYLKKLIVCMLKRYQFPSYIYMHVHCSVRIIDS